MNSFGFPIPCDSELVSWALVSDKKATVGFTIMKNNDWIAHCNILKEIGKKTVVREFNDINPIMFRRGDLLNFYTELNAVTKGVIMCLLMKKILK